jgi:cytochrome b561
MVDAAGAMALDYEQARYSKVAIWLHWSIALLILANIPLGFFRGSFGQAARGDLTTLHKSIGLTVLALTLVRIAWRFTHRPPAFDPVMRRWEASLARAVHLTFYALLLAIPITGWLLVSSGNRAAPTNFFWLFPVGTLPTGANEGLHDAAEMLHDWLAWPMMALILLHVGGAVKHHLDGHRHLLGRMAPFLYRRR